jgi:hypothetical protein
MTVLLDEYKTKLITKILFAASQQEVERFVDTAMRFFEQDTVSTGTVSGFVEKISSDLALFNPIKKDAQQWSNIKLAIILFNRIRSKLNEPVNETFQ